MANVIHETTQVAPTGIGRSFRWVTTTVGVIATGALIGLLALTQFERSAVDASAATADSYRQFAEAMELVPAATAGAATADSYRQFAEAMELVPAATAGAATADSYRQFAEAMELVPAATAGAATADSYRQFAEAMELVPTR